MPPSEHAAGAAPDVVALARRFLAPFHHVHFAPSIPLAKEARARRVHGPHLPVSEPILVLYDGTAFGSAEEGFVVTPARLCWKNHFEHPRQVAWSDLDPARVAPDAADITIAGGAIRVLNDLDPTAAVAFFHAMAARAAVVSAGPYRAASGATGLSLARLLALARAHLGEVADVHYHPAIPPAKLVAARAAHARVIAPDEEIAVVYDDTLFGSAEYGFVLTPARLCWKNLAERAHAAAWSAIDPAAVALDGNAVHLADRTLHLASNADLAPRAATLFIAAAREARAAP